MTAATKAVHIHLRGHLPRDSFREGWGELTKRKSPALERGLLDKFFSD